MVLMTIIDTNLITAFSCRVDNKKNIVVINGNRLIGGWIVNNKLTTMVIDFREVIKWIDITLENKGYTGIIEVAGLGIALPNLMTLLPNDTRFTYRINLPEPAKGKLTFNGSGGSGEFTIFNISGFEDKQ
jgi:hypothetical protein